MELTPVPSVPVIKARAKIGISSLVPRPHARSLAHLRDAHPGLGPDELAERLVTDAVRHSAAVGAAAACCALVPVSGAAALAMAGESAAVSALRTRLAAELYTAYGLLDPSPTNEGRTGYLAQWASRDGGDIPSLAALSAVASAAVRTLPKSLRRRLPNTRMLLALSAVAAGLHCGRGTRLYGEALWRDLRADPTARSQWPEDADRHPS